MKNIVVIGEDRKKRKRFGVGFVPDDRSEKEMTEEARESEKRERGGKNEF